MEAKIGNHDIRQFQKVAKKGKVPKRIDSDQQSFNSDTIAQMDRKLAEDWARKIGNDGYIGEARDLESRFTPIGINLLTGDFDSAVLGLLGLLETRVEQLQKGGAVYEFIDGDLEELFVSLRVSKLAKDSPIYKLFEEYKELKDKNQLG